MRPIRIGFRRRVAACLPALFLALACASGPPADAPPDEAVVEVAAEPEGPRPVTSEEAVADFEAAWKAIDESHFDPEFNGLDWSAIHDEYLPRVEAVTDINQLREVLDEMLKRLGQSHFGVIPIEALPPTTGDSETPEEIAGGCGLDFRLRAGQLWLTAVEPGSPAAEAGVQTEFFEYYDVKTGYLVGQTAIAAGPQGNMPTTAVISDYKKFGEMMAPTITRIKVSGMEIKAVTTAFEFNKLEDKKVFVLPPEIQVLLEEESKEGDEK